MQKRMSEKKALIIPLYIVSQARGFFFINGAGCCRNIFIVFLIEAVLCGGAGVAKRDRLRRSFAEDTYWLSAYEGSNPSLRIFF